MIKFATCRLCLAFGFYSIAFSVHAGNCAENITSKSSAEELVKAMKCLDASTVPSGTVAFLKTVDCPEVGWTRAPQDWEGRYLVTSPRREDIPFFIGSALSPRDNRAAGSHTHPITNYVIAHKGNSKDGLSTQFNGKSSVKINVPSGGNTASGGVGTGTNAPYVGLTACIKK